MNAGERMSRRDFEVLYRENKAPVIRFLYGLLREPELCEDIAQDVFLKIYERDIFVDPEDPRSMNYLFTVARNMAIDFLRREQCRERKYRDVIFEEVEMDENFNASVEDYCIEGEVLSTLHDAINSFPEEEKRVFVEKHFNNTYCCRITEKYDISFYRIKKIERRIAGQIKKRLKPYYSGDDENYRTG